MASRVRFLIDGEEYFSALASAAERAREQLIVVGWDLHSKTRLRRDRKTDTLTETFEDFLNSLARRNEDLRIYLLQWDFAMIYVFEREILPLFQMGWQTHDHIKFRLDDKHPVGASHHQKIVVIDNSLAFVGGLDITAERWDTRSHLIDDSRRTSPDGKGYAPFHDVQVALEGEAAGVLGELARERWQRSSGQKLSVPSMAASPWPDDWEPDLQDVNVAVARTYPKWETRPEIREVEKLFLDAIAAAVECIYLENQYITSRKLTDALAARLEEENPPEIVLITRFTSGNWMEEATLDVLRARVIKKLRQADHAGKLRVFFPVSLDDNDREVKKVIHSKVSIFDDTMLRIGSANLSNRSMGLDTECDVAFESDGDTEISETILNFRNDLLAEHLGIEQEEVNRAVAKEKSLIKALDNLAGRYLKPLDETVDPWLDAVIPENEELLDPEKPIDADRLLKKTLTESEGKTRQKPILRIFLAAALILTLSAAWRWTPLNQWLEPEKLAEFTAPLRESGFGPLYLMASFILGGLLMVPVTAMILATALIYASWTGFFYSLAGALISAAVTYAVGAILWKSTVQKIAGKRLETINRYMQKQGTLVIAILRVVPVAPFTVINMVAGSSKIGFRSYSIGTVLGMAPGILAINVFADQLKKLVSDPNIYSILIAAGVIILIVLMIILTRHLAEKIKNNRETDQETISDLQAR